MASTYSKVADFVSWESFGNYGLNHVPCYPGRYHPIRFILLTHICHGIAPLDGNGPLDWRTQLCVTRSRMVVSNRARYSLAHARTMLFLVGAHLEKTMRCPAFALSNGHSNRTRCQTRHQTKDSRYTHFECWRRLSQLDPSVS